MAVPWLQIVQLVPSVVEVSRELLKRSRQAPAPSTEPASGAELAARLAALEENERRQAELVSQMAEQLAGLARAVTVLHRRVVYLSVGLAGTLALAILAVVLASR